MRHAWSASPRPTRPTTSAGSSIMRTCSRAAVAPRKRPSCCARGSPRRSSATRRTTRSRRYGCDSSASSTMRAIA
jgi:hypothetical protein